MLCYEPRSGEVNISKATITEIEKNNCFSIDTQSDLNKIGKETIKRTIWLTAQIMREKFACSGNYSTCAKVKSLKNFLTWKLSSLQLSKSLNGHL